MDQNLPWSLSVCYGIARIFIYSRSMTMLLNLWTFNRFNDFGVDGGPAAKELAPKLDLAKGHLSSRLGVTLPKIEVINEPGYNVLVSFAFSVCVFL